MPHRRRRRLLGTALAAAASAAALLAVASTGSAAPSAQTSASGHDKPIAARIMRPRARATVSGAARLGVRTRSGVRRLELRVDGRLAVAWSPGEARPRSWRTATVADGRHLLELRAFRRGGVTSHTRWVTVRNNAARSRKRALTPPAPAPSPAPPTSLPSPAPPPSSNGLDIPGTILRVGDYNTGNLSQWSSSQKLNPYSLTVVGSPSREGGYAARFEVRRGDDPLCAAGWGCYGDRAEVQMSTGEAEGQERWYSWSTMIAADFPRYSTWQVISQWHANAAGSPPIGFYAENDDLVLQFNRHSGPGQLMSTVNVWRGSLRRGQWQDIRLHVNWSASDSVGFVELWINGVPQTFDNGQTRRYLRNLYPGVSNYFKQGYYRQGGLSATGVVYHDGFRMSRP
jgi:hypothetical protein